MSRTRGTDVRRTARRRPQRQIRQRGLVVAEGKVTEKQYIDTLKQLARGSHTVVKTVGVGRDPLGVVTKAVQLRAVARRDEPYDWVCVVVDTDDHTTLAAGIELAAQQDIHVVVSNPCFEIWLLWHLEDHFAACTPAHVAALLSRHGHTTKSISRSFPCAEYARAQQRALIADPPLENCRLGPNPSSSMPVLLTLMGLDSAAVGEG